MVMLFLEIILLFPRNRYVLCKRILVAMGPRKVGLRDGKIEGEYMKNAKFLIVDDSPVFIRIVNDIIEKEFGSQHIFRATDGLEALEILQKEEIDIIISDWEMPKISGDELVYTVRNDLMMDIPFIMMTSHGETVSRESAIKNGVTECIIKPFKSGEMEKLIAKSWDSVSKKKDQASLSHG